MVATAPAPAATVKANLMAPSLPPTAVLSATPEAPTVAHLHMAATVDLLLTVAADLLTVATVLVLDPLPLPDMEVTEATAEAPMVLAPPLNATVLPAPPDPTLLPDQDMAVPLPHTAEVTHPALLIAAVSHVTLVPALPPRDTEAPTVAPPSASPTSRLASTVCQALASPRRSATKTHTTSRRRPEKEEFLSTETPTVTRLVT